MLKKIYSCVFAGMVITAGSAFAETYNGYPVRPSKVGTCAASLQSCVKTVMGDGRSHESAEAACRPGYEQARQNGGYYWAQRWQVYIKCRP